MSDDPHIKRFKCGRITQRQFGAGWRQPHKSHHFCASWHPSSPFAFVSECKILLYEIFSGALCFSTLLIAALFVCIINLTNLVWEGGSWKNCHPNSLFHHLLKPGAILIIMLCCMHAEELDANNCMQTSRTLRARTAGQPAQYAFCVWTARSQYCLAGTHACRVTSRWQNHKNLICPLCCWRANDALFIFPAIMRVYFVVLPI